MIDTVNASNSAWPIDEWKRLVNVGLSRAIEAVVVIASRAEMDEPYLRSLCDVLKPAVLKQSTKGLKWVSINELPKHTQSDCVNESAVVYKQNSMGKQIADRKKMLPIMSQQQQQLVGLTLDGKPRLVRGVAGSGKSVVLCNWLAKTVHRLKSNTHAEIWVVFANRSLNNLLRESIESAWQELHNGNLFDVPEFPWSKVQLLHVRDVLSGVLPAGTFSENDFDYEKLVDDFLAHHSIDSLLPRCTALFIDEAQDLGHSTLKLLLSLVKQADPRDTNSRPAHIFYDNAQNVYGRKTPKWSEFGLDMRGRSRVLRESYRSSRQIVELAANVLHRLTDREQNEDHQELIKLKLISTGTVEMPDGLEEEWLTVNFNQVEGICPSIQLVDSRTNEMELIARHIRYLIEVEQVSPGDICILYVGKAVEKAMEEQLKPALFQFGIELSIQKSRTFERRANTLLATTPHSFKGYESEVVLIPGIDQFVTGQGAILAHPLYVAMTRARSVLSMYGIRSAYSASKNVVGTVEKCVDIQARIQTHEI
ncbi:MAG: AAA family ATPase [Pirellulaceae bacterium]